MIWEKKLNKIKKQYISIINTHQKRILQNLQDLQNVLFFIHLIISGRKKIGGEKNFSQFEIEADGRIHEELQIENASVFPIIHQSKQKKIFPNVNYLFF